MKNDENQAPPPQLNPETTIEFEYIAFEDIKPLSDPEAKIQNCKIGTGNDCVSIVNASSNIKMKTIYCGPGHGISIGSLGKDNSTAIVTNVVLSGAFIRDATNGVRIKTWQGGSGYVQAVRFENVRMESVANPIIIDQFYCDSPKACLNQARCLMDSNHRQKHPASLES